MPSIEKIVSELEKHFSIRLKRISNKRIIYSGKDVTGKRMIVCSPESKIYPKGYGWSDLTLVQTELLDEYDHSILAFRMPAEITYYVEFKTLKPFLIPEAMLNNKREGDHWKLYIWPNEIQVLGNKNRVKAKPNTLSTLIT